MTPPSGIAEAGPTTPRRPTTSSYRPSRVFATPRVFTRHSRTKPRTGRSTPLAWSVILARKNWGDEGYAREELVAELGAAFLCADLELTPEVREDHAP